MNIFKIMKKKLEFLLSLCLHLSRAESGKSVTERWNQRQTPNRQILSAVRPRQTDPGGMNINSGLIYAPSSPSPLVNTCDSLVIIGVARGTS